MKSKEKILLAVLELASENGLGSVSLSQIAEKVGVKKATLYSHFSSKGEIVDSLYGYLRENAKTGLSGAILDYGEMVKGKTAPEILHQTVAAYRAINADEKLRMFYTFILSERVFNKEAARIMVAETEKMILAVKQLFYAMHIHHVMHFTNVDMAALSFAMAIHSLLDYREDKLFAENSETEQLIHAYIDEFCAVYGTFHEQ
ncbi:MAG: TetR/AcrR family transcriptional regulator [Spirochaetaceae bacterium]|jgi:AcrR family transcriptional regulator|nr:TetR/AcrR family transcriptional regulator [Spirochaetaceae bacterium]